MKKPFVQAMVGLAVLAVCLIVPWVLRNQFQVNPLVQELPYEYPSFATVDAEGNSYLIDRSQKRIVKTSNSGNLVWSISGGTRDRGTFYFADEVAVDQGGFVYVINRVPDAPGFFTVTNQVLRFRPDGTFDQVVAEKHYPDQNRPPTLVQRGHWHSLQARDHQVAWFDSTTEGLVLYSGAPGSMGSSMVVPGVPADLLVTSAALTPIQSVVYVTRQGRVLEAQGRETRVLWDASATATGSTPWRVRVSASGRIFFTDLARSGVAEVQPDGTAPLWYRGEAVVYSLSMGGDGSMGIAGDAGVSFLSESGQPTPAPAAARFSGSDVAVHLGLWLLLILAVVDLVFLGWLLYVKGFQRQLPRFLKTVAGVVALTTVVTGFVSVMILANFSERYSTEVLNKVTQLVHLVPKIIPTDRLEAIQDPGQFGGPEYMDLRNTLIHDIYGEQGTDNQGLYFALHRVSEGHLTTFMYLNGDTTIRHPFSYLEDPEGPYQKALKGETVAQYALDAWGSWMYATGPIRTADGRVIGVFEMGGDLYSFTQENNRLIESLLLNVVTAVVVFLLILVESTFLQNLLSQRKTLRSRAPATQPSTDAEAFRPEYLVRPLTAVFFVGTSLTLLFLPLMTKELYEPLGNLPENVVLGLPVSLRLFFFGLGTVIAGTLCSRWGWRPVFLGGAALLTLGLGAAAVAPSLLWFLLASVPIGLGTGLGMIGLRSLIRVEGTGASESQAYSHFYAGIIAGTNVGVIVGTALADLVGFANVSWFAALVTVVSAVLVLWIFPQPTPDRGGAAPIKTSTALRLFFTNPAVFRFGLFLVLPVYVASMVLYFFFPLYAAEVGVSNADMGRVFLLNGLMIIYLGPPLSRFVHRRFGVRGSIAFTSLLWAAAMVPFIVTNDLWGLIFTILLMALAEATAAPAQNEHLMSLPITQTLGTDRAVGYFEVLAKIGETLAPTLIGFAILLGAQWGIALIAGAIAVGLVFFLVFDRQGASHQ